MKCPSCHTEISDRVDACPSCNFTLAVLDTRLPPPPLRSGYVHDFAKVLSKEEILRIEQHCHEIFLKTQAELIVVTVPRTKPVKPSEYVFWLANRWNLGGAEHRGIMILLALEERRIESEVGYSLEPVITDEESFQVLQRHVVPFLQKGNYGEGLYQAVDILGQIIEGTQKARELKWWKKLF